jgi:hypothetical protein
VLALRLGTIADAATAAAMLDAVATCIDQHGGTIDVLDQRGVRARFVRDGGLACEPLDAALAIAGELARIGRAHTPVEHSIGLAAGPVTAALAAAGRRSFRFAVGDAIEAAEALAAHRDARVRANAAALAAEDRARFVIRRVDEACHVVELVEVAP